MELAGAAIVTAIVAMSILVIVKGWRIGGHRDDPNLVTAGRRARTESFGNALADAVIVLTVFSFDLPVAFVGEHGAIAGRIMVGCALLVAMSFLPSLVRPLVAVLAGLTVMLSGDGSTAILLAPLFLVTALVLNAMRH